MDTGLGKLAPISQKKAERLIKTPFGRAHVFFVGETVNIRGSLFKVQAISKKTMKLRIIKDQNIPDNANKI